MEANGKKHSVFTVLRTLRRRKFYLVVPVILITAGVAIYSKRLPVRFRAKTLVASETAPPEPSLSGRVDTVATVNVQEQLHSIRETILGPSLLENVIREFNLYDVSSGSDLEKATSATRSRVQIQVDSPDAFYVGFEGDQPQQVMLVANRLAALFVERTTDIRGQRVAQVDSVLDGEVERLRAQLKQQEEGLKSYQNSVASELPDRLGANLKSLETLQQQAQAKSDQIAEAQARRQAVVNELHSLETQGALEPAPREKTTNEIALEDLRSKLRQLKTRYTADNPEIQRAEKELRDLEAQATPLGNRREPSPLHMRYVALQAELPSIDQRVKSYQQERDSLTSQMAGYERRISSSPGLETTITQRMRDLWVTRSQYETMLVKQQAQRLDQRVQITSKRAAFKVAEPAQLPTAPSTPQRRQIILLAFLASLGLGLAAIFIVEQMDTSFQSIEEVQGFTTLPVLSAIPGITNSDTPVRVAKNGSKSRHQSIVQLDPLKLRDDGISPEQRRHLHQHRLTVVSDPQSIASQQYGILTLKVQRWRDQTEGRVLAITSAAGGEGKSLTALNLSMSLASSAEGRVLLVDCDLRRPQVHERLGLTDMPGFSDLLAMNDCDVNPFIAKVGSLYVMPGGTELGDPGGLLSTRRTREILARLKQEFQLIVLDSPPLVPIADSHFLAGLADGVVLVIRARQTRRELLQRAAESLGGTNIVGVVLNDVEYADTRYAYAYRYYQRHYTRQ